MAGQSVSVIPFDDRESGPNYGRPIGENVNVGSNERMASMLAGGGLLAAGLLRRGIFGLTLSGIGAGLLYRGITGHCTVYDAMNYDTAAGEEKGLHVIKSMTIDKPAAELYTFWRNFENLPAFMDHLKEVRTFDSNRSHWVAKGPMNTSVEWDAEIINERENELIAWRSLPDADVQNMGSVNFRPAPGGRGTEVKVTLQYDPPGGMVGAQIARLFGEEPSMQIEDDLRRFKRLMETGEIITTEGQSRG